MSGYGRYINQVCPGNELLGHTEKSSASDCGHWCDGTAKCVGFVFSETMQYCWLKDVCENIIYTHEVDTYKKPEGKRKKTCGQ